MRPPITRVEITRSRFLTSALIALLSGAAPARAHATAAPPAKESRFPMTLTDDQRKHLLQALAPLNAQYDPAEKMLRTRLSTPGYHSKLKAGMVHSTRDSLSYAAALLDTGDPALVQRGQDIISRVIALQDQDPESKTYGIWSWFLEETLAEMSPPDWNWADFCGVPLLQAVLYHRATLPADLTARIDAAIHHAAASIRKRNVGPDYTNIAVMGTYVTLIAAETYDDADLKQYAMARLRRFHDYSVENGGFTEYNSPNYTITALSELGRLRLHVRDEEARRLVEAVYR
ncbi:MAG: hypothetical protein H7Z41_14395, partial [Cytophagales bacterium]|nr:hypothetical protein [Armatimonadota bacterium]